MESTDVGSTIGDDGSGEKYFTIEVSPFNDGHYPGRTKLETKIAHYHNLSSTAALSIFDNLLDDAWCNRAYEYGVDHRRPWGVYVSTEDALNTSLSSEELWKSGDKEKAIGLEAVRSLVYQRAQGLIGKDVDIIHGTAIWCLMSGFDNEVRYHLDYAELYRYETNIIYPPLYAGTCQVSPVRSHRDMQGGDFAVNTQGLEHYRKFGYKGKLQSPEAFEEDFQTNRHWVTVPYLQNRGILHDGTFPHLSTKIHSIKEGLYRVILGFNCFPKELKECNERAPEHSDAFNRTIKIYQAMASTGIPVTSQSSIAQEKKEGKKGINVKDIMKNPVLAKLLVTAAKKVKEEREIASLKSES